MSTKVNRAPSISTFIVRFSWAGWAQEAGVSWYGRVNHVQSGDHCAFTDLTDMMRFIQDHLGWPVKLPSAEE